MAFYDALTIEGLTVLDERRALRMIVPDNALIQTRRARVFTKDNLEDRVDRILDELDRRGHRRAQVVDSAIDINKETGAVAVSLRFEEGPRFVVGRVETVDGERVDSDEHYLQQHTLHTREWERENRQLLLNEAWHNGYADARVRVQVIKERPLEDGIVQRDLRFVLLRGEQITLESVHFETDDPVRGSVLRRQTDLRAGEPLDRVAVSDARRRLMALGVFRSVDMRFEDGSEPDMRKVFFDLQPGTRQEVSLLAGWGSYELARGGILWQRNNLWHRAHRLDVDTRASVKARSLSTRYTIPQLFGTDLTGYSRLRYSFREELSFDSETIGANFGTRFVIPRSDWGIYSPSAVPATTSRLMNAFLPVAINPSADIVKAKHRHWMRMDSRLARKVFYCSIRRSSSGLLVEPTRLFFGIRWRILLMPGSSVTLSGSTAMAWDYAIARPSDPCALSMDATSIPVPTIPAEPYCFRLVFRFEKTVATGIDWIY